MYQISKFHFQRPNHIKKLIYKETISNINNRLKKDISLGTLAEFLKHQTISKISKSITSETKKKQLLNEFKVNLFCFQTESGNNSKSEEQEPLSKCFMVSDLVSGPLGSTQHLKLRASKNKNVKNSKDPKDNLELMMDLSFGSEKAFLILRDAVSHQDFMGIEAKKHFLKNFIEMETSRALRPFQPAHGISPRNMSIGFKASVDKNDLSNMGMRFRSKRGEEEHSEYNLFHFQDQTSNHLFPDSNFLMLNNSNRNSMGYFRGPDSQFHLALNSKATPGEPPRDDYRALPGGLEQEMLKPESKMADLCFSPDGHSKNGPQLTPLKSKNLKSKGFRDLRSRGVMKMKEGVDDLSNLIYYNDRESKNFELTQKDPESLHKRARLFENGDTPILDFNNVKQKIYQVENLKRLKPRLKERIKDFEEKKEKENKKAKLR